MYASIRIKTLLILIITILKFGILFSQNNILLSEISVKIENKDINDALDIISKKTGYYFSYDAELISGKKTINLNAENETLKNVLDKIFDRKPEYGIIKNIIVIKQKNEKNKNEKNKKNYTEFSGTIIEAKTKKPLSFVSIGIENTACGTFSNLNGEFILKIPDSLTCNNIHISHIGYESITLKTSERKNPANLILKPVFVSIEEVIIKNKNPNLIIGKFLSEIKNNYQNKPGILTAFYREGIINKNKAKSYSEAVFKIYKQPFNATLRNDKIKILQSRKTFNISSSDSIFIKLKNGPYDCLKLDFIKNGIDFLQNPENYDFKFTDITEYDNENVYLIEFKPASNLKSIPFKGKLYINSNDFALIKADFEIELNKKNKRINFVRKKTKKYKVKPVYAGYSVKYKKVNGKYIINHVRTDIVFKSRKKYSLTVSKHKVFSEIAVLDYYFNNTEKFKKSEILKRNTVFINNKYEYDPYFWKNISFISPERQIKETLETVRTKIKSEIDE